MSALMLGLTGSEVLVPKAGRSFFERDMDLERESRTASGRLVTDKIARKKVFTLVYDKINNANLDILLGLYDLDQHLNFIITDRDSATRSYTVKMRPAERQRWSVLDRWIWRNVTFELEEV